MKITEKHVIRNATANLGGIMLRYRTQIDDQDRAHIRACLRQIEETCRHCPKGPWWMRYFRRTK